jgi:hypothetical protein
VAFAAPATRAMGGKAAWAGRRARVAASLLRQEQENVMGRL